MIRSQLQLVSQAGNSKLNVLVRNHVGETVGADQIDVAGQRIVDVDFGDNGALNTKRPRHKVLVLREPRLLPRQYAVVNLLLQQAVVSGDLLQNVRPKPVESRVAYVRNRKSIVPEQGGNQGCPHARILPLSLGRLENHQIGSVYGVAQERNDGWLPPIDAVHVHVALIEPNPQLDHEHCHRDSACDLPGVVAPHAIREDGHAKVDVRVNAVFIVVAQTTDIRGGRNFESVSQGQSDTPSGGVRSGGQKKARKRRCHLLAGAKACLWMPGEGTPDDAGQGIRDVPPQFPDIRRYFVGNLKHQFGHGLAEEWQMTDHELLEHRTAGTQIGAARYPVSCSSDIQDGVPSMIPDQVRLASVTRAIPKSLTEADALSPVLLLPRRLAPADPPRKAGALRALRQPKQEASSALKLAAIH